MKQRSEYLGRVQVFLGTLKYADEGELGALFGPHWFVSFWAVHERDEFVAKS